MTKIFIGLLFISFNYNLEINGMLIGLVPSFVGYLLIYLGLNELTDQSERFQRVKPFVVGLFLYWSILYIMDLIIGKVQEITVTMIFVEIAAVIAYFYTLFSIICGLQDIEYAQSCDLYGEKLYKLWNYLIIVNIATYLGVFLPILLYLGIIASFVLNIVFLITFNKAKNNYNQRFQ